MVHCDFDQREQRIERIPRVKYDVDAFLDADEDATVRSSRHVAPVNLALVAVGRIEQQRHHSAKMRTGIQLNLVRSCWDAVVFACELLTGWLKGPAFMDAVNGEMALRGKWRFNRALKRESHFQNLSAIYASFVVLS